jgi:hypothetical protein
MIKLDLLLAQNRVRHFKASQDWDSYNAARKAITDLRKYWNDHIWPDALQKFKKRLQQIHSLLQFLQVMLSDTEDNLSTKSIYDLILWNKLIITEVLCKDYTVRKERLWTMKTSVLKSQ